MDITLELTSAPTDDVRSLVGELEDDLAAGYPPEQRHGLAIDAIFQPHIRFFVARAGGAAVGCAGLGRLCLETGTVQHAAMRFYSRVGFSLCAPFGAYVAMPAANIGASVFFEKHLAPPTVSIEASS